MRSLLQLRKDHPPELVAGRVAGGGEHVGDLHPGGRVVGSRAHRLPVAPWRYGGGSPGKGAAPARAAGRCPRPVSQLVRGAHTYEQDGGRYFLLDGHVHSWNIHPGSPRGQVRPPARRHRTAQLNARLRGPLEREAGATGNFRPVARVRSWLRHRTKCRAIDRRGGSGISADPPAHVAHGVYARFSHSRGLYAHRRMGEPAQYLAPTNAGPGTGRDQGPGRRHERDAQTAGACERTSHMPRHSSTDYIGGSVCAAARNRGQTWGARGPLRQPRAPASPARISTVTVPVRVADRTNGRPRRRAAVHRRQVALGCGSHLADVATDVEPGLCRSRNPRRSQLPDGRLPSPPGAAQARDATLLGFAAGTAVIAIPEAGAFGVCHRRPARSSSQRPLGLQAEWRVAVGDQ